MNPRQADQHHGAAAVGVAEPAAGDQVSRRRARSPETTHWTVAAEVSARTGSRDRDVDDRDVEQRHEADDQRHREDPPAPRVRLPPHRHAPVLLRCSLLVLLGLVLPVASGSSVTASWFPRRDGAMPSRTHRRRPGRDRPASGVSFRAYAERRAARLGGRLGAQRAGRRGRRARARAGRCDLTPSCAGAEGPSWARVEGVDGTTRRGHGRDVVRIRY